MRPVIGLVLLANAWQTDAADSTSDTGCVESNAVPFVIHHVLDGTPLFAPTANASA